VSVIDELLAFDAHPELLELRFSCDGLLALPFFRWALACAACDKAFGWQTAHAQRESLTLRERGDFWMRSALANPLRVDRTFDLVIFGSSAGAVLQEEGRWFDRINDYFAVEFPERTLVVDAAYRGRYKAPRFPRYVRYGAGFSLWAAARSRLARPSADDDAMLDRLVAFLRREFPVALEDAFYDGLRAGLRGLAGQLPFLRSLYRRFFERVRPKVLFFEDGSYGGSAHIMHWARAAGIVTAEFQHGLIAPSLLAYNYGDALLASGELATYLPQYVLLYGQYWVDQLRTTSERVVIGWPHFARRIAERRKPPPPGDGSVMVISQGTTTGKLVTLIEALAARFPDRRFVFRLHPGEVPFHERYARLSQLPNVLVSNQGDIYDCFAEASLVVGHSSTALVEAVALGIPTFIYDDESSRLLNPEDLGTRFTTADELAAAMTAPLAPGRSTDQFWARYWQANYRAFIERVAG
jgi:hypothetical protein